MSSVPAATVREKYEKVLAAYPWNYISPLLLITTAMLKPRPRIPRKNKGVLFTPRPSWIPTCVVAVVCRPKDRDTVAGTVDSMDLPESVHSGHTKSSNKSVKPEGQVWKEDEQSPW